MNLANDSALAAPSLPRISDYVEWLAEAAPEAEALVNGGQRTNYGELALRVQQLARALIAAGVLKGDRVATLSTPHPDYFVALLATASIGAIWVGLNPRHRREELRYVIADCEPTVLLARSRIDNRLYLEDIEALRAAAPSIRHVVLLDADASFVGPSLHLYTQFIAQGDSVSLERLQAVREACGTRDPCLIVYTSGSTGEPKGAVLCHEAIVQFSLAQNRVWPLSTVRMLNYFPISHVGCVVDVSCPTLVAGGCCVFLEKFTAEASLSLMAAERITCWASVPSVFQMQLASPHFAPERLSAVELILWEGAGMPQETIFKLIAVHPRLATNYGLTEASSAVTVVAPTDDVEVLTNSVGEAAEGVEIRLVSEAGDLAPDGMPGELQARSRYNMLGYWRRPLATAEAFANGEWLRTGDVAVRRSDGRYRLVGRLKEMYKSGGYNVYPREIERVIESHPHVAAAAVVAVPDPLWQEVGIAYVVPKGEVTPGALDEHCRAHLANYKVPKYFVIQQELPLLPIGKVDKVTLRRMALTVHASAV